MRTRRVKIEKLDTIEENSQNILVAAVSETKKSKKPKFPRTQKSKPGRKNRILESYIYNGVTRDVQHEIDRITFLKHRSLSIVRTQQILTEVCALHNRFIRKHNERFGTSYRRYLPSPRDDEYFMQQETIMLMEDMLDIELQKQYDMATCEMLLVELQKSVIEDTYGKEADGKDSADGLVRNFEKLKIDMLDKMSEFRMLEEKMRNSCNVRVTPDSEIFSMPAKRMKIDEMEVQESENPTKISFTPESMKIKDFSLSNVQNTNEFEKPTIPATN